MNKFVSILVVLVLIMGGWYFLRSSPTPNIEITTIDAHKTIDGNYSIEKNQKTILKNGATLTIAGDLDLSGTLECDGGPLAVTVKGNATINSTLLCARKDLGDNDLAAGITLIVKGSLKFSPDATIVSNGHVQIASDESSVLKSQSDIDAVYEDTAKDSGSGPRIGPFVSANPLQNVSQKVVYRAVPASYADRITLIPIAHAQQPSDDQGTVVPNIILSGHWYVGAGGNPPPGLDIPTPPKGVRKIILNFDFGAGGNVDLKNFYLAGPSGRDGEDDIGKSCNARGTKGEDAFRMRVKAANISLNNFTLELGNGGKGGDAETIKDCDPGIAKGGDGGEAGNFKMTAAGSINIASFRIIPGSGGGGGEATAQGKDGVNGCPGKKGGDATATGGNGGKNKKELAADGAVAGISNVTIDRVDGGIGGLARVKPGVGGSGTGCNCAGGKGGNGTATGGTGGDASVKVIGGTGEAYGGDGGDADSHGGTGGAGGNCPLKPSGGNGGRGGDAKSKEGQPGKGTSGDGQPGAVKDETGGDGGNGGSGCGPGGGGKGGSGKPPGNDGKPGEKICPEVKNKTGTTVTPPPPPASPGASQGGPPPTGGTTTGGGTTIQPSPPPPSETINRISVIQYGNRYLPVDQLIQEGDHGYGGCGELHWHAVTGAVKATDGSVVPDPGPPCGYGTVAGSPAMQVNPSP